MSDSPDQRIAKLEAENERLREVLSENAHQTPHGDTVAQISRCADCPARLAARAWFASRPSLTEGE